MITNVLPVTLDQAIPVVHALHPVGRHFLIDGYHDGKQATMMASRLPNITILMIATAFVEGK